MSRDALAVLAAEVADCRACGLARGRTRVVVGEGPTPADILFIGEGPGAREDELGRPFVGRSGALLDRLIEQELGRARSACYIANIVKCRPPENRRPKPTEISACLPFLMRQIELVNPTVTLLLGLTASQTILGENGPLRDMRGRPHDVNGRTYFVTYHPSAGLRGGAPVVAEMCADFARVGLWGLEHGSKA
jgi:uracil-DNA glycosylase family 4